MTVPGIILFTVGIIMAIVVAIIMIGAISRSSYACFDCKYDDKWNEKCEQCEHYKQSLRYDYVKYWEPHSCFKKKGRNK